jgi:hypothetical protein
MPVFTDYPTTKQTSLNDILGPLSSMQQYQQAKQLNPIQLQAAQLQLEQAQKMNPLTLQSKQMEIDQAQKMNPLEVFAKQLSTTKSAGTLQSEITQSEQAARQSQIATQEKQFAYDKDYNQTINQIIGGYKNDPRLKSGSPKEVASVVKDAEEQVKRLVKSDPEGEFKTEMRFAPIKNLIAQGKHDKVDQVFKNLIQTGITPASQQSLQTKQLTTVGGAPAVFNALTGTAEPLTINEPQVQPQGQPQGQPQSGPLPPGMPGMPQGQTQGVTPTQMGLPYPVRKEGDIRPYAPSEADDQASGYKYRNELVNHTNNLPTLKRNINEVIKGAEELQKNEINQGAGFFGKMGRSYSEFMGTEMGIKYKELSKNLANVQLANMQAMGLRTDADKTLQSAANGDYTYPPEVLQNIAHRAQADLTNIELQAKGAQEFTKKYGDNNIKKYQQMWSENAKDTRIFEAIAINNSDISKEEKIKKIDKLFQGASPQEINNLTQQKNTLLKLSRTGEL